MKDLDQFINELKNYTQWVNWGVDLNNPKTPYNPVSLHPARTNDPSTWGNITQAVERIQTNRAQGLGFVFNNNGLVGVDLDTVRDPETGAIADYAINIIEQLDSYTEVSISGYGVHIIARGNIDILRHKVKLPPNGIVRIDPLTGKQKQPEIEMYKEGRYFIITGNIIKEGTYSG